MAKKKIIKSKKVAPKQAKTSNVSVAKPEVKGKHSLKVPLIIAGSVIAAAGIAVGATFIAINASNKTTKDLVSEQEIDNYLKIPSGTVKTIDSSLTNKIKAQAMDNIAKLNAAEIENLSSYPFFTASQNSEVNNTYQEGQTTLQNANDLTGIFVSNKAMQIKNVYGTKINIDLMKTEDEIPCFAISAIDQNIKKIDGNTIRTKITTDQTYLAKKNKGSGDSYQAFVKSHIDYQGLKMPESYSIAVELTKEAAITQFENMTQLRVAQFVNYESLRPLTQFYTDSKGTVYCVTMSEKSGPSVELSEELTITTTARDVNIWRFREDKTYGWVLDSYAADGKPIFGVTSVPDQIMPLRNALYVDKNEHGEQLSKPFSVNKMKGFVKLKYGDSKTKDISDINYVDDETIWAYKDIEINRSENVADFNKIKDITPYYRFDNPGFKGFKFYGTDNFFTDDQIYLTSTSSNEDPATIDYIGFEDVDEASKDYVEEGDPIPSQEKHYIKSKVEMSNCVFDITLLNGKYTLNISRGVNPGK